MNIEIAEKNAILICEVGSHLYGLNVETSDIDHMGIMINPIDKVIGFHSCEQVEHPEEDYVIYDLRKFCRLAMNGNPTILQLLWAPEDRYTHRTYVGKELCALRNLFLSRRVITAHLGYLTAQKRKIEHSRQQRPELIHAHGYDTKFAMHAVRLGIQGLELAMDHTLSLPMRLNDRNLCMDIREGKIDQPTAMSYIDHYIAQLEAWKDLTHLPKNPMEEDVENWMIATYMEHWEYDRKG